MAVAVGANIVVALPAAPAVPPAVPRAAEPRALPVSIEPYQVALLIVVSAFFGHPGRRLAVRSLADLAAVAEPHVLRCQGPAVPPRHQLLHVQLPVPAIHPGFPVLGGAGLAARGGRRRITSSAGSGCRRRGRRSSPRPRRTCPCCSASSRCSRPSPTTSTGSAWTFSPRGKVTGASYTDIHAVLPAKLILLFISLLCAVLFIYNIFQRGWILPAMSVRHPRGLGAGDRRVYPAVIQQFTVQPNESEPRSPLHQAQHRGDDCGVRTSSAHLRRHRPTATPVQYQQYPPRRRRRRARSRADTGTLPYTRLLDPNKLSDDLDPAAAVPQLLRFRAEPRRRPLHGQGHDPGLRRRGAGARPERPVADQRNWINLHLTYTHGNGFVAAPANTVDATGRPVFTEQGSAGDRPARPSPSRASISVSSRRRTRSSARSSRRSTVPATDSAGTDAQNEANVLQRQGRRLHRARPCARRCSRCGSGTRTSCCPTR